MIVEPAPIDPAGEAMAVAEPTVPAAVREYLRERSGHMDETATMTLTEFLLARIGDDEAVARAATPGPWHCNNAFAVFQDTRTVAGRLSERSDAAHIARHDPTRVLAECEAKRRIVALYEEATSDIWADRLDNGPEYLEGSLRALAVPYADHPDYRDEWRAREPSI